MLVSGENLCGANASGALLLSSTGSRAVLLNGPTPHIVGDGVVAAGSNWQAGVAVGNRAILLRGNRSHARARAHTRTHARTHTHTHTHTHTLTSSLSLSLLSFSTPTLFAAREQRRRRAGG